MKNVGLWSLVCVPAGAKAPCWQRRRNGCPAWSHSRSTSASKPRTVRQSGSRMTCAIEQASRVPSMPSVPCTTTDVSS
uniref:Putative secreted protein n=1 Tax=Ixodes ricinus TaxID=34613 RepID=A0A6B0TUM1_IXORI